jgi:23S rRNA (cytidine1920-2'-O)/16S rRNA (cytidine1409-2'-O)-methyltransferase
MEKKEKLRLDHLLVARGLVDNPSKARARIMAGDVIVNEHCIDKPGQKFPTDVLVRLRNTKTYVSRAGLKLIHALKYWHLDTHGVIAIDVGASTGGFTEVLLNEGASLVYAVDVGYGQLALKLRSDNRVIVMEKTHILHLTPSELPKKPNFAVIDVSFISLKKVLPHIIDLLTQNAILIALIKPQFEAGTEHVEKGGIVRNPLIHDMVVNKIIELIKNLGLKFLGVEPSPILGTKGNKEFLLAAKKDC